MIEALQEHFPDIEFVTNEQKPRRLSFEINLHLDDEKLIQVWSGINRAPRKEKFPDVNMIKEEINKHLFV